MANFIRVLLFLISCSLSQNLLAGKEKEIIVRIVDDSAAYRIKGDRREFFAKIGNTNLYKVRFWKGEKFSDGYGYPSFSPPLFGWDEWQELQKEWEEIMKKVRVERIESKFEFFDQKLYRLSQTGMTNCYLLRAEDGVELEIEKNRFRYPPPSKQKFRLAREVGKFVPVVLIGDQKYIPVP